MAASREIERSPAAKALAKMAGWREALRRRLEALSFRRLVGKGGVAARRRPPTSRLRRLR